MPYHLSEDGLTVLKDDGTLVERHPSKAKALAHLRALQINVPEAGADREAAIQEAHTAGQVKAVAEQYGLSVSHVYRLRRALTHTDTGEGGHVGPPQQFQADMTQGLRGPGLFRELGTSGLKQYGGNIDEDYDRMFKPLSRKVKTLREMGDDPIVAAVLQAIKMLIRRVSWYVEPGGEARADQKAAEFLESCMNDMSLSWMDAVDQSLGMIQYGFSVAEIVYKRRTGPKKDAGSKYDDGRIGWRKWLYLGQDSLAPGSPWTFDASGGLQAVNQMGTTGQIVQIPIDKALLFRTTSEKNNPEGRAVLRAMYGPYYYCRNLQEIEAISAERLGAGLPVVYAGGDVSKSTDPNSDFEKLKDIVRNVRMDEQMGVAIPFSKMGGGAREGEGVLFELITPSGGKAIDFHQVISRYEQRMAMVGLAQFIHLGMNQVGARSLGESTQDFFKLSVSGWADLIEETIHRYATERLFGLNQFPGLTDYPRIKHDSIVRTSLTDMADYINRLVGAMVITPDANLEAYLRELAELPEKDEATAVEVQQPPEPPAEEEGKQGGPEEPTEEKVAQDEAGGKRSAGPEEGKQGRAARAAREETTQGVSAEAFALRGSGPGRRAGPINAVNAYQRELQAAYDDWADELAQDVADTEDEEERRRRIEAALIALAALLIERSHRALSEAFQDGLAGAAPDPALLAYLAEEMTRVDQLIETSLIPAIRDKLLRNLMTQDLAIAFEAGQGAEALKALLDTIAARVGQYSGEWWAVYNHIYGSTSAGPVAWYLDPNAKHCHDCPRFGSPAGKRYESYAEMLRQTGGKSPASGVACGTNCRCQVRRVK